MSQSFHLFRVQQIDRQLEQIEKRNQEIDSIVNSDEDLQQALTELQTKSASKDLMLSEIRELEKPYHPKK